MNTADFIAAPVIVVLAIITGLLLVIVGAILFIRARLSKFSQEAFGTRNFYKGLQQVRGEVKEMDHKIAETPKSLRAMTQIYLPQIHKDFPEFDYDLYANKAQSVLRSYFNAINAKDTTLLTEECSQTLRNNVYGIIEDLNVRGYRQTFNEVAIHNIEIARYLKNGTTVTILLNAAVGCYDFVEDDKGKVVFGSRERKKQCVYDIELIYIQDVDKMGLYQDGALGVHCPNCGAPVKTLGQKYCEYCGSGIQEVNTRSWSFESIREQTVHKTAYK